MRVQNQLLAKLCDRIAAKKPLVFAHRGNSFLAPENTLLAAWLGYQSGAVAWEFDVRLTRDRVPVVLHDSKLTRTTDVAGRFEDDPRGRFGFPVELFDWAELQTLDAGGWFLAVNGGSRSASGFDSTARLEAAAVEGIKTRKVRIPSLAEALDFTIAHDWLANVEIKSGHDNDFSLVDEVMRLIRDFGCEDRVLISSFDHAEVERVVRASPKIATGVLSTTPLFHPGRYVREIVGADAYHVSAAALGMDGSHYCVDRSVENLRTDLIRDCGDFGLPVCVYTVNESQQADHLVEAGVAGLFSDDSETLSEKFYSMRRRHLNPPGSCWAS